MSRDKITFLKIPSNGTQATILHAVRDCSPVSRSGIVAQSGLPHAAVSRAVADLLYFNPKAYFDRKEKIDWKKVIKIQKEIGYPVSKNINKN